MFDRGNYNSTKDMIESRYSVIEIRQMYARLLSGRGKYANLHDIARKHKQTAGQTDIDLIVEELARDWKRFSKTTCA